MVQAITMLLGMGLASALGDGAGIVPMVDAGACYYFCSGVLAILVMRNMRQSAPSQETEDPVESVLVEEKQAVL